MISWNLIFKHFSLLCQYYRLTMGEEQVTGSQGSLPPNTNDLDDNASIIPPPLTLEDSIHINRSIMPSHKLEETLTNDALDDLQEIGVETFLASEFEANVIKQVDEQLESKEKLRSLKRVQELEEEEKDILYEIESIEKDTKITSKTLVSIELP